MIIFARFFLGNFYLFFFVSPSGSVTGCWELETSFRYLWNI